MHLIGDISRAEKQTGKVKIMICTCPNLHLFSTTFNENLIEESHSYVLNGFDDLNNLLCLSRSDLFQEKLLSCMVVELL